MSDDVRDTVRGMAALVVSSNRISQVHEKSLLAYPFIFFDGIKEVRIDYDLSHRHDVDLDSKNNITVKPPLQHCYVSYYLIMDDTVNTNLDRRFQALEDSVKTLFWKDLTVKVYFNEKIVYESKKYVRK